MTYEIKISKGYDGWQAISEVVLEETSEEARILRLRTSKVRGGLAGSVRAFIRKKDLDRGFLVETSDVFGDFYKNNIAPVPCKRVTEKAVHQVHKIAFVHMDTLIEEAKAFYAEKAMSLV